MARQTAFICHNAIVKIFRHLFSGPAPFMRQCVFLRGPAPVPSVVSHLPMLGSVYALV